MKIVILTQVYNPDTVSVSQHLTDLAEYLSDRGHDVSVITSRYGYDTQEKYSPSELSNGVKVLRVSQTNFSKSSFLLRVINFLTFNIALFFRSITFKGDVDLIIGTTSPPFSSLVGIIMSRLKKAQFCYWVMDLQPELAIESGLLKKNSWTAKFFMLLGNFVIKRAQMIISLDRFMTSYLKERGADSVSIIEVPPWPVSQGFYRGSREDNPFRNENSFGDRTVVMFSGNHAFVHPLETLLNTSLILSSNKDILFVFVGGGVRKKEVLEFKNNNNLENIIQLPFQPRSSFHISIASSDIQVVVMGNKQVGFTHPNKIYGAMFLARPIIYIGPPESHVSDILENLKGNIIVNHGDHEKLKSSLIDFSNLDQSEKEAIGQQNKLYAERNFSSSVILDKITAFIENPINY